MKYKAIFLILILTACGSEEETPHPGDTPDPGTVIVEIPEEPACWQKSNSPAYPDGVSDFKPAEAPNAINNHELGVVSETLDCLLSRGLITEEEWDCLILDAEILQIVYGTGLKAGGDFGCTTGCAGAGCINDNTFILNQGKATDDTIRHETCHRAKHLTDGDRGHDDAEWWHDGINDCVCERVIL